MNSTNPQVSREPGFGKQMIATALVLATLVWLVVASQTPPHQSAQKFGCVVNCMDGRVQDVVKQYMQKNYGVAYVDVVTEAGPNKILAAKPSTEAEKAVMGNIKQRIDASIKHHHAKVLVIAAHAECAGNPASKNEQIRHLRQARETVRSFGFKDVEITLLWVESDWKTVIKIE